MSPYERHPRTERLVKVAEPTKPRTRVGKNVEVDNTDPMNPIVSKKPAKKAAAKKTATPRKRKAKKESK